MTHRRLALAVLLSCACLSACLDTSALDEPVGEQRYKQIMLNQLPLEAILLNTAIGTEDNLSALISNPLSTGFLAGVYGTQLAEPEAQMFMKYLVRCALAPEDPKVEWSDPFDENVTQTWSGELGLCSEWASGPPSSECLELVSACLLASENAVGKSVAISLRGLDLAGGALPGDDAVKVKTLDENGVPLASFHACVRGTTGSDRNCGWSEEASFVGTCTPGSNVALQCDVGSQRGVVRVCEGHTGCNHGSTAKLIAHPSMCDARDQLAFTCPAGGSYAVMAGPTTSGNPVALDLHASTGQFPASELEVFDRREGAYFGTLLKLGTRATGVQAWVDSAGVVHRNVPNSSTPTVVNDAMYACHDINFEDAEAYATHRLCAVIKDPGGDEATLCAAHPLGVCREPSDPTTWICDVDDTAVALGDGDFGDCTGDGVLWDHPITVFLDHPCDLAGPGIQGDQCPGYRPWQP